MRQKVTLSSFAPSNLTSEGSKASDIRVGSIQHGSELRECGAVFSECNKTNTTVDKIQTVKFKLMTNSF